MAKIYRILSLDGGGIRGLMTAIWLKRLEDELGEPLYRHFDLIAGTSTGAILACGISKGIDVDRIIELYVDRGREVFPARASRWWSRATRVMTEGVSAPKYDGSGLDTTYDVLGREGRVFKNDRPEYNSLKVWELCRASAAAPSYFPAHVMQVSGTELPLIDGGVVANNPTACAIAEGIRINSDPDHPDPRKIEDFVVASFGTGEATRPISIAESKEWGALEWALPVIDVLFDGSADSVHYIASQLVPRESYFRFQARLSDAYDDLDNADTTNLHALIRLATQYIDGPEGKQKMADLVARLIETP